MTDQQRRIQSFRTTPDPYGPAPSRWNGHAPDRGDGHGQGPGEGAPSRARQHNEPHNGPHRASTGQLVTQAAGQISTLVRTELALGKAELVEKGKRLGLGGGLLATAGLLGLYALGLLIALFVAVLDIDWPLWLAVLVPLLAIGALILVLGGLGARKLRTGAQVPTQAAHSLRDDIQSVKHAFSEGRNQR